MPQVCEVVFLAKVRHCSEAEVETLGEGLAGLVLKYRHLPNSLMVNSTLTMYWPIFMLTNQVGPNLHKPPPKIR
jgi:hypothetical protein